MTNYSANGTIGKWSEKPNFISDRTKIVFQSDNQNNRNDFFSMSLDGTNVTKITNPLNTNIYNPFITSANKLLLEGEAMIASVKYYEIYVANSDFSNLVKLTTTNDGSCFDASSNSTNTKIVYANSINGGQSQIYSMSIDGSQKTLLTTTNTSLWRANPKYSPNGSKIVFEGSLNTLPNKHSEIFIMNSDGSGITQLTNYSSNGNNGVVSEDAIFSKDGNYIYYVSDESGVSQIYRMNIDGSQKVKLTNSAEDKYNLIYNKKLLPTWYWQNAGFAES